MFELFNEYTWTQEKQEVPQHIHGMPELGNITHFNTHSATPPSPTHYHSNFIEFHCMIKGVSNKTVFDSEKGSHSHSISGNEIFLIFPFELHHNGTQHQGPLEFFAFQINVQNPEHILCLNPEYSRLLYDRLFSIKSRHLQLSSTEITLIRTAFNLLTNTNLEDRTTGMQFLTCFLFNLSYLPPIKEKAMDDRLKQTLDYVNSHISEALYVEKLAQISGYSISRFEAKFKQEIGFTPSEYITIQKVSTAKKLLETSDMSITSLAYELGFSSSNYFASVFKKIMGCTPREFRKQFIAQKKRETK